jgi:hypothetical protein
MFAPRERILQQTQERSHRPLKTPNLHKSGENIKNYCGYTILYLLCESYASDLFWPQSKHFSARS